MVRVWFAGANPYVLEYKKFDGSNPWFRLPFELYNAEPTLSGFGNISSSAAEDTPAPNCTCISPSSVILVIYLLGTFFNFNSAGVSLLNAEYVSEYAAVFGLSSNTVSCPR